MAKIMPTHQNKTYLRYTGSPVDYTSSPVTFKCVFVPNLSPTYIPVDPTGIPFKLQWFSFTHWWWTGIPVGLSFGPKTHLKRTGLPVYLKYVLFWCVGMILAIGLVLIFYFRPLDHCGSIIHSYILSLVSLSLPSFNSSYVGALSLSLYIQCEFLFSSL